MPSKEFLAAFGELYKDIADSGLPKTGEASFGNYRSIKDLVGGLRDLLAKYKFYLIGSIESDGDVIRSDGKVFVRKLFSLRHYEFNDVSDHMTAYASGEGNLHPKNCFGEATAHTNALKQFLCDLFCLNSTEEMEVRDPGRALVLDAIINAINSSDTLETYNFQLNEFKKMMSENKFNDGEIELLKTLFKEQKIKLSEKLYPVPK